MPLTHLLYLHGFRSSPASAKARRLAAWSAARPALTWACPALSPSPQAAMDAVQRLTAGWPAASTVVMGSSLGGFYATALAEARGWRAVLLNPAIDPARDLSAHLGPQTAWHDPSQTFDFTAAHLAELRALQPPAALRQRYLAVIAKGDEVLDWREMQARYLGQEIVLLEGGDHGLSDFEPLLPRIERFLA